MSCRSFFFRFSPVINLDFYHDLVDVLDDLMESGELGFREQLHIVQTVFTILSGHGEALNIDPIRFYTHLYRNLLCIHAGENSLLKLLIKDNTATKFGSCLVLGVLTVGLYSLVIKTTETAFFSAVKIRLGSEEFFFLKSELFRCEKVQKGLIQPGRHLRNVLGLQLFRAVDGTHRIPKMCYISNMGENWIFAGYFNVTFCLNFTIFF